MSGFVVVAFILALLLLLAESTAFFGWLRPRLMSTFDWMFVGVATIFVLFCLFLIVSPFGRIRPGGKDATSDYSYVS